MDEQVKILLLISRFQGGTFQVNGPRTYSHTQTQVALLILFKFYGSEIVVMSYGFSWAESIFYLHIYIYEFMYIGDKISRNALKRSFIFVRLFKF